MTLTDNNRAGASPAKISPENFDFLCNAIYKDSGIVLDQTKNYLLEARLAPLAKTEGAGTIDSLCNLIRATGGHRVRERVVEAMTTNETLFFRDVKPFEALKEILIPEITKRQRDRTLRIWSAACSSGQEPYTIAMIWRELRIADWRLNLLGTDLSDEVLEKARSGRYLQLEVNRGLPASYLVRNFERDDADWVVRQEVRAMVQWQKFNLQDRMQSLGPFDIVFCRNVLIYFDNETKAKILGNIRGTLKPGGYLILGASETTLTVDDAYQRVKAGRAVVYQNPAA